MIMSGHEDKQICKWMYTLNFVYVHVLVPGVAILACIYMYYVNMHIYWHVTSYV